MMSAAIDGSGITVVGRRPVKGAGACVLASTVGHRSSLFPEHAGAVTTLFFS